MSAQISFFLDDIIFSNSEISYADNMCYTLYQMCTYCIIVCWNPDLELLHSFMPEFLMLFMIFVLFVYCILGTFSNVLSEEQFLCKNTEQAIVRRIMNNKQLPRVILDYPPAA